MPRALVLSLAILCLPAAGIGFWMGLKWQPLDETQVISRVAQAHLAEHGGRAENCLAVPGQGDVWLSVICDGVAYDVDHQGRASKRDPEA